MPHSQNGNEKATYITEPTLRKHWKLRYYVFWLTVMSILIISKHSLIQFYFILPQCFLLAAKKLDSFGKSELSRALLNNGIIKIWFLSIHKAVKQIHFMKLQAQEKRRIENFSIIMGGKGIISIKKQQNNPNDDTVIAV